MNEEKFETRRVIYKFKDNPNGYIFSQETRESIVEQIKELSKHDRGLGEFCDSQRMHTDVNLQMCSHLYSNPELVGDELHLNIRPLKTPYGIILNQLFWDDALVELGFRGLGNINQKDGRSIENYKLISIDVIHNPRPYVKFIGMKDDKSQYLFKDEHPV